MPDDDTNRRDPQPNLERLRNLENDLLSVRRRAEETAQERRELEQRLKQAEEQIETLRTREERTQEQIETTLAAFNELVDDGVVPKRIHRKTVASFAENLASYVVSMNERLNSATDDINALKTTIEEQTEQLKLAETTLKNAHEQSESLRNQIDERIAQFEETKRQLEAELEEARQTISDLENENDSETVSKLIEANRDMSDELALLRKDFSLVQETADDAKKSLDSAKTEAVDAVRKQLQSQISTLQKEKNTLETQLGLANKQLQADGKTPYLSADRVAGLLNNLVDNMQSNLKGVSVSQGEFKLKLAVGGDSDTLGFVVPTPDASTELSGNLQEVTLRFDKSAIQPLQPDRDVDKT
ncbi:MAG: hypothetical protein ACFE0Q_20300 [Anaerolineae bacterium]